jgi:hypothetical protein
MRRAVRSIIAGIAAYAAAALPAVAPARAGADAIPVAWGQRDVDRIGWWAPDFVKVQTGGYVGFVAAGFGYAALDDAVNLTFLGGHTPAWLEGSRSHVLALDLAIRPVDVRVGRFRVVPLYFGAGGLYVADSDFFVKVPDEYRDSRYYFPTALHWTAHAGVELDYLPDPDSLAERHGVFVELRTMDTFAIALAENTGTIGLDEIFSTAVGYRLAF